MGATAVVAATAVSSHRDREEDGGSLQGSAPLLLPVCDAIIVGGLREMKWGGGDEAFGGVGGGTGQGGGGTHILSGGHLRLPFASFPLPLPFSPSPNSEPYFLTLVGEI